MVLAAALQLLVALAEFYKLNPNYPVDQGLIFNLPIDQGVAIILSLLIGGVTFTGSMIAFGKLQGLVTGKVVKYPWQHPINAYPASCSSWRQEFI